MQAARPPNPDRASRFRVSPRVLPFAGLIALAFVLYANTLRNDLVQDDLVLIPRNPLMHDPGAIEDILLSRYWGNVIDMPHYRPLTVWTIALNYAGNRLVGLPGADVVGFHLVNLLLHAAAACLVYVFARRLGAGSWSGLVSAALFVTLPIHTEAVAAITGRSEPLALALGLGFLILHRDRRLPVPAALLVLLALWSKESALAFLPLAVWMDVWFPPPGGIRRKLPAHAIYAAVALAWLALRAHVLRDGVAPTTFLDNPLAPAGLVERLMTAARVQILYLTRILVPIDLSSDYSYDQIPLVSSAADPHVIAFILGVVAVVAIAWRSRRRHPMIPFAGGGYAILFAATSNFIVPIVTIMAERLAYAPAVMVCLLLGRALARVRRTAPRLALVLVGLALVVDGALTVARNRTWVDAESFYRAQIQDAPRSAKAWYNRGRYFESRGVVDSALVHYRGATDILPGYWAAWNNIGLIEARRGDVEGAIEAYRRAIAGWPDYTIAHYNLGRLLIERQDFAGAARALEVVVRLQPDHARAFADLGGAYLALGRRDEARAAWRRALELDPGNRVARAGLERTGEPGSRMDDR